MWVCVRCVCIRVRCVCVCMRALVSYHPFWTLIVIPIKRGEFFLWPSRVSITVTNWIAQNHSKLKPLRTKTGRDLSTFTSWMGTWGNICLKTHCWWGVDCICPNVWPSFEDNETALHPRKNIALKSSTVSQSLLERLTEAWVKSSWWEHGWAFVVTCKSWAIRPREQTSLKTPLLSSAVYC